MLAPDEVAAMVRLHRLGWGTKRVAGELGCSRNTVKRYLAAGGWVAIRKPRRKRRLDGLEGWLAERFRRHRGNCDVVRQELLREHSITVSLRAVASPGGARPRRFRLCRPDSLDPRQVRELATCRWVAHGEALLLLGPPGVGKTHLAIALDAPRFAKAIRSCS
jgi:hypothetical protein